MFPEETFFQFESALTVGRLPASVLKHCPTLGHCAGRPNRSRW